MFAAPPVIQAEIFARLPGHYRKRDTTAPWLVVQRRGLKTHSFLEGPCFDGQGNLYVTDIPFGRIFKVTPAGDFQLVVEYDGEPNGLKIVDSATVLIADHKNGIVSLDLRNGRITPHCDRPLLERFKGVNDLFLAANGDLYFTDQGQSGLQDPSGRVFRLSCDGRLTCLISGVPSPNGIVLDHAEEHILLAVTRANQVWRMPLLLDGSVSKVGAFINLSGGVGPDGLALDRDGRLAVCHPGIGSVWLFDRYGEPLYRITSPAGRMVTNGAWGGTEGRTLYMTESETGAILRAIVPPSEDRSLHQPAPDPAVP